MKHSVENGIRKAAQLCFLWRRAGAAGEGEESQGVGEMGTVK